MMEVVVYGVTFVIFTLSCGSKINVITSVIINERIKKSEVNKWLRSVKN